MKLSQLLETPLDGGDMRKMADDFSAKHVELFKSMPIEAEIENFDLRSNGRYLSLWDKDVLVAVLKMSPLTKDATEVDDLWVKETYRGKKLMSKLLWYIKSRLNFRQIIFGSVHSDETKSIIMGSGFKMFTKYWLNNKTGEKIEVDSSSISQYYPHVHWKFVLEQHDEELENWPRFLTLEDGFAKMSYEIVL